MLKGKGVRPMELREKERELVPVPVKREFEALREKHGDVDPTDDIEAYWNTPRFEPCGIPRRWRVY